MHTEPIPAPNRRRAAASGPHRLAPTTVECQVDYLSGPAESWCWTLAPAAEQPDEALHSNWVCHGAQSVDTIEWLATPQATLESQCRDILAVHLFGSATMPPRIVGKPLWIAVAATLRFADDTTRLAQVEIHVNAPRWVTVRRRTCAAPVWSKEQRELRACDADPLRALLDIGLATHPSPYVQVPLPAVRRVPAAARRHALQERQGAAPAAEALFR